MSISDFLSLFLKKSQEKPALRSFSRQFPSLWEQTLGLFSQDGKLQRFLRRSAPLMSEIIEKMLQFFQRNLALPLPISQGSADIRQEWQQWEEFRQAKGKQIQQEWAKKARPQLQKYADMGHIIDPNFCEKQLFDAQTDEEIARARDYIANEWKKLLQHRTEAQEFALKEQAAGEFLQDLHQQIDQYERLQSLLAPFGAMTGRLWDLSRSQLRDTQFNVLLQYAELLKKSPQIQELAEMLGRFRAAERIMEEEEFQNVREKPVNRNYTNQQEEYTGIRESDDLNNLIPSELVWLADPQTESIFFKKFAEKKLQTWEYRARTRATSQEKYTDKRQKQAQAKQGPIIICVDTSGSMQGIPEQVAKMLAFAILQIAISEDRACYLVSFSTTISCLELTDKKNSLSRLVAFLSLSFHGGTDAQPALQEALRMLQSAHYQKADILMISDFIMQSLPKSLADNINYQRQSMQTKFHALIIGSSAHEGAMGSFDHTWHYDQRQPDTLLQLVKKIKNGLKSEK